MSPSREELIADIRRVAIACNPEIVELKMGCRILWNKKPPYSRTLSGRSYQYYCGECREGYAAGAAISPYRCGYCRQTFSHGDTAVPAYCKECAKKNNKCQYCKTYMEVVGRELTLADILGVMDHKLTSERYTVNLAGGFQKIGTKWIKCQWNLRLPFEEQEDEVLLFIHGLVK